MNRPSVAVGILVVSRAGVNSSLRICQSCFAWEDKNLFFSYCITEYKESILNQAEQIDALIYTTAY